MSTYRPLSIVTIDREAFGHKRISNALKPDTGYKIVDNRRPYLDVEYFYTPDGMGGYWYDTLEELKAENE